MGPVFDNHLKLMYREQKGLFWNNIRYFHFISFGGKYFNQLRFSIEGFTRNQLQIPLRKDFFKEWFGLIVRWHNL